MAEFLIKKNVLRTVFSAVKVVNLSPLLNFKMAPSCKIVYALTLTSCHFVRWTDISNGTNNKLTSLTKTSTSFYSADSHVWRDSTKTSTSSLYSAKTSTSSLYSAKTSTCLCFAKTSILDLYSAKTYVF